MTARRVSRQQVRADDESTVSDIRIGTDGRVHVFGTSREILEALAAIGVRGDAVGLRLDGAVATIADHPPSSAPASRLTDNQPS
jgi:hypothetical protein